MTYLVNLNKVHKLERMVKQMLTVNILQILQLSESLKLFQDKRFFKKKSKCSTLKILALLTLPKRNTVLQ